MIVPFVPALSFRVAIVGVWRRPALSRPPFWEAEHNTAHVHNSTSPTCPFWGAEHNTRSQLHLTNLSILGGRTQHTFTTPPHRSVHSWGEGGGGAEHNTTSPTCPFWGAQHNTTHVHNSTSPACPFWGAEHNTGVTGVTGVTG